MKTKIYHHIITAALSIIAVLALLILLGEQGENCTLTQLLIWKAGAVITIWGVVKIVTRMEKKEINLSTNKKEE